MKNTFTVSVRMGCITEKINGATSIQSNLGGFLINTNGKSYQFGSDAIINIDGSDDKFPAVYRKLKLMIVNKTKNSFIETMEDSGSFEEQHSSIFKSVRESENFEVGDECVLLTYLNGVEISHYYVVITEYMVDNGVPFID